MKWKGDCSCILQDLFAVILKLILIVFPTFHRLRAMKDLKLSMLIMADRLAIVSLASLGWNDK